MTAYAKLWTKLPDPHRQEVAPKLRVIVVNYNSGPWLQRCIDSLARQSFFDFEVVIVDNASTDDSLDIRLSDGRFRIVCADHNLGFAAANNLAAAGARNEWLALLNPDAIADPEWLAMLLSDAAQHPGIDIFGSTQIRAGHRNTLDGTGDCLSAFGPAWRSNYGLAVPEPLPSGEVFSACGAAMMIRRTLFESLGGFEERFFCFVEDVDFCFRARLSGHRVWQSARARVEHAGGGSSESDESLFSIEHGYRNALWMHMRCSPFPLLLLSLPGQLAFTCMRILLARERDEMLALCKALWRGLFTGQGRWQQRRKIQAMRTVSSGEVASWLSWNPLDIFRRKPKFFESSPRERSNIE